MVEYWNVDLNKKVAHLLTSLSRRIFSIEHFFKSCLPIIPSLQYSNIPIVSEAN
jgi:hypothetical protein